MTPLTPYMLWLKFGIVAVMLIAAFIGGCRAQAGRDAGKIEKLKAQVVADGVALGAAADALRAVSAQTKANEAAAKAKAARAADAVKAAEKIAKQRKQSLDDIARQIERDMRDPDCRRALEATTCTVLQ